MKSRIMMWANYRRGPSISVPSPADGDASIPWWYDKIASLAHEWASIGVTDVLFPPPLKTNAGAFPGADGYGAFDDYDIGDKDTSQFGSSTTRFGNGERLRRAVAICHANGMNVLIDHVMHQRQGGKAGVYRYLGAPSEAHPHGAPDVGRFPKDPPCFRGDPPRVKEDPVPDPPDDFEFGDELCPIHAQPPDYVAQGLIDAGDWLFRTTGADGARLDDMKGISISFMHRFMTTGSMNGKFYVGEYADGNRDITDKWTWAVGNLSSAMDFDFHYHGAQPMCNEAGAGTFFMGNLANVGMRATKPFQAVPFVESLDSDVNGFATVIFNKALGYALLLSGQGLPMIYLRDYLQEPDCYGEKVPISNLSWCHHFMANGDAVPRLSNHPKVYVEERVGQPGMIIALNNDVWNPEWYTVTVQTNFGANVRLHDFTGHNNSDCWTDAQGKMTFGVPPGADGRGYGWWSRAELQGQKISIKSRPTTQTFFGAADLHIGPAINGTQHVGRIWCAGGSDISGKLAVALPEQATIDLVVMSAGGEKWTYSVTGNDTIFPEAGGHLLVPRDGWMSLFIAGDGLPAEGVPFESEVTYTAPLSLAL